MSTACVIVIGNEILSGRTQDSNLAWLALALNEAGVRLKEARIIPDSQQAIIDTINACRMQYDYVFTTGGIGPTHDDITSECISQAFGVPHVRHPEAEAVLTRHYGQENLNAARLKMAEMPEGATLIHNPVSAAPGFIIGNVYVLAGVPRIMQAMFDELKHKLLGGKPIVSDSISIFVSEGMIAEDLSRIQSEFPDVEIGSYPFVQDGRLGTSLVARHESAAKVREVCQAMTRLVMKVS